MSTMIYADVAACLNKKTFKCLVYGGYTEQRIPQYYKDFPENKPIFVNPEGASKTKLTIVRMIALSRAGDQFTIVHKEDIQEISRHLGIYIAEHGPLILRLAEDAPAVDFLNRCRAFLALLEPHEKTASRIINKRTGSSGVESAADVISAMMGG